jgi:hypothetical protein
MRIGRVVRCALVVFPLLVCAGRLHAQRTFTPDGAMQEINRCLSVVRATASRRRSDREREQQMGPAARQWTNDNGRSILRGGREVRARAS